MRHTAPTVYLSRVAWEHLDAAQAVVDQHHAGADGMCVICRAPDPCPTRTSAATKISRYGQLPRRRPVHDPASLDATASTFAWFNEDPRLVGAR
jgi:hypothetical protein